MWDSKQLFFGLQLGSRIFDEFQHPAKNSAALWGNFKSNKSAPANRKKGFYTGCQDKNEEI